MAAVQLTQAWEAIDCESPTDFFDNFSDSKPQVFVADDAFGRTEYDTARGSEWGRQLHKVIQKLDNKHWLIWTSRMHILRKALDEMSLQGKAANFPKPAEVIVNARKLSFEERALILYRHARAAGLEDAAKTIIRGSAAALIINPHFTPERIRRFVVDALPELTTRSKAGTIKKEKLAHEISESISNPTDRMRKAYLKLDEQQRWLLIALLESGYGTSPEDLEETARRFIDPHRPIADEIQLLREGFIEESEFFGTTCIDWIHPSYRDLVIEQLEKDEAMCERFLHSALSTASISQYQSRAAKRASGFFR